MSDTENNKISIIYNLYKQITTNHFVPIFVFILVSRILKWLLKFELMCEMFNYKLQHFVSISAISILFD